MKVKYSPDFARQFKRIPPSIQRQFRVIDMEVSDGKRSPKKWMGWAYYVEINDYYAAMGSMPEKGVFYWIWIGTAKDLPVIL